MKTVNVRIMELVVDQVNINPALALTIARLANQGIRVVFKISGSRDRRFYV